MSTKKKLLQAASGVGGAGLDVDEVFSTTLYKTNNTSITVTTGLDGTGSEKVLYWSKPRVDAQQDHYSLVDNERQSSSFARLASNRTDEESTSEVALYQFTSTGYLAGQADYFNGNLQGSASGGGVDQVTWGFKEAPNFFQIVTYTGDGTSSRNIPHSLNSVPGFILVKRRDASSGWRVFHRSEGATKYAMLQSTNAFASASTVWNNTNPTSTVFTVGSDTDTNGSGGSFVAYLFSHHANDGSETGFGPDGDSPVISCGSYTGNGSSGTSGPSINLGFEPQWVMIKRANNDTGDWKIFDAMRGVATGGTTNLLRPNTSDAELANNDIDFDANGFNVINSNARINASGSDYIYVAIRRGPLAEPTSATDVFAIDDRSGGPPNAVSGFPVDMGLFTNKTSTDNKYIGARLIQGKRLYANLTDVEGSSSELAFDYNNGFIDRSDTSTDNIHFMWRRAPSYFDVVTYEGTGSNRTVSHNLGVAPEMMWIKNRDNTRDWNVYHSAIGATKYLKLNGNNAEGTSSTRHNDTEPTASVFTVGTGTPVNTSGESYIAFLFSTLAGISKVGSYTGDGTLDGSRVIDCGFSAGARFVLIKVATDANDWHLFDSFRGIVAGNDPRLRLNSTLAETTTVDFIDPDNSGFIVGVNNTSKNITNVSGETYIFYAIA